MAESNSIYQVVYRGESLTDYARRGLFFFQQPTENRGGF